MKVEELMITNVGSCHPEDQASAAARIMWERDCGAVPVVDDASRVVGMVTDRDLCMASCLEGKPLHDIAVRRAMSDKLWSCQPQDDISDAEKTMRTHRVRRVPVTDDDGKLRGILSLSDLSREALTEARSKSRKKVEVSLADVAETLGDINVPHAIMRTAARAS